jgi:peptidoglycan/xylan/chitin deacetylase (PgdA/CDA1 family)
LKLSLSRLVLGRAILSKIGAWKFNRRNQDYLLIFNWHQVTPSFDPEMHHAYTWTPLEQFVESIEYLQSRYDIVSLESALGAFATRSFSGRRVALTFDDGDRSISEYVVPHLSDVGLPATFFINTAYFDGHTCYWFPVLEAIQRLEPAARRKIGFTRELEDFASALRTTSDPVMYDRRREIEAFAPYFPRLSNRTVTPEWLATLDGERFAIGAHGHEHQRFAMMPAEWQRADLAANVRLLSEFAAFRPFFAVPFGRSRDWNSATLNAAASHNLAILFADGGVNLCPSDCWKRIPSDNRRIDRLVPAELASNANACRS